MIHAYGVAKTPLGTYSSYLSRSRVRGQVVSRGPRDEVEPDQKPPTIILR
jgi:hypothetical protein